MVERILVIKHGALGDIIQGFDAFASLRTSFPDAAITVLTTAHYAEFLKASGWFNEVVLDRRSTWNLAEAWRMRTLLRRNWTKIIDLQCSERTAFYARIPKSDVRWYGTASTASDPTPDFTGMNTRTRMLTTVCIAGAKEFDADLSFLTSATIRPALSDPFLDYALLLPSSSTAKPSKRWPVENYVRLANQLAEQGVQPVLAGSEIDRPVTSIIAGACASCLDLTGQADLFALAGLAAQARCVIGNDTGPVFLAARLHVPTLTLMGADTDPAISAPFGRHAHWIKKNTLAQLSFDEVWTAVASLLY